MINEFLSVKKRNKMLWPYLFVFTEALLSKAVKGESCSVVECMLTSLASQGVGLVVCSCSSNDTAFLPICSSDLWDVFSASALCAELGFVEDAGIPLPRFQPSPPANTTNGFLTIESVKNECNDLPFSECVVLNREDSNSTCSSDKYAAVSCSDPNSNVVNGDIRLVNVPKIATEESMGVIEIYTRSNYGTVCNNLFDDNAADVVCRQLGYADGTFVSSFVFRPETNSDLPPIFYADIMCDGSESKLIHCPNGGFRVHDCNHRNDAAVICRGFDTLNCSTGDTRLVGGALANSGRVEVCLGGVWGTVCSNGWDDEDAASICVSLGFNDGVVYYDFGPGTGPIWFTNVDCLNPIGDGISDHCLLNSLIGRTENECTHDIDAGAHCIGSCNYLADGFAYAGRLEVCDSLGNAATICATNFQDFNDSSATVACVSIGFVAPGYTTSKGYFNPGSGPILYSEVKCQGQEQSLEECETKSNDLNTCDHEEDVGIVCHDPEQGACNDGELMLNSDAMQVMVCFTGVWGNICADRWDNRDGEVACRQLGLPTEVVTTGTISQADDGPDPIIWLTNLECMGSEDSLVACSRDPLGVLPENCATAMYATINCSNEETSSVVGCIDRSYRLVPPSSSDIFQEIDLTSLNSLNSPSFGRVEVCFGDQWLSVCYEGFGDEEAGYICDELGYMSRDPLILYVPVDIDEGSSPQIATIDVSCQTTDGNRRMCDSSITVGEVGDLAGCTHRMDVGVHCEDDEEETEDSMLIGINTLVPVAVTSGLVFMAVTVALCTALLVTIVACMRRKRRFSNNVNSDTRSETPLQTFTQSSTLLARNRDVATVILAHGHPTLPQEEPYQHHYLRDPSNPVTNNTALANTRTLSVSAEHLDSLNDGIMIPSNHIRLMDCIGQGEYGRVYKAHLIAPAAKYQLQLVAVKTLKGQFSQSDVDSLMEETIRMKAFNHNNVLGLLGVCIDAGSSPYVVLPYMANGSLLDWLKRERNRIVLTKEEFTEEQITDIKRELLSFCLQIANGMCYLSAQMFIHRDLAARNCMMDDSNTIKVSDFGLSLKINEKNYFRQEKCNDIKLPIKWMAIESMTDGVFSEKSDVWSFGVTCWEIFSGGKMPYGGLSPMMIPGMLENGERLDIPNNIACSTDIFSVIQDCWQSNVDDRPAFTTLISQLDDLLTPLANYIDFSSINMPETSAKEMHVSAMPVIK